MHFQKLPDFLLQIQLGNEQKKQVRETNQKENLFVMKDLFFCKHSIK